MSQNIIEPTSEEQRFTVLDILRGIAILGMIISHFDGHSSLNSGIDHITGDFVNWFVDGKFYTIFAILFGAGFAIQLLKTKEKGEKVVTKFIRRMLALACFGFLIEVGTGYAILVSYATCGLLLILIRNWSTKALLVLFFICLILNPIYRITYETVYSALYGQAKAKGPNPSRMKTRAVNIERFKLDSIAKKTTSFPVAVKARAERFIIHYSLWDRKLVSDLSSSFMLILLGFIGMRSGIFKNTKKYKKLILWLIGIGIILWALSEWGLPLFTITPGLQYPNVSFPLEVTLHFLSRGFGIINEYWLAFLYIGIVVFLVSSNNNKWNKRFSLFVNTGKMALTNYMLQALILSLLFANYGFAISGVSEAINVLILAPLVFILLAFFSRWWLNHFRYGPLEWLWRCITYWKIQPILKS